MLGWDQVPSQYVSEIEQLQDQAFRFVAGTKGKDDVEDAKTRLGFIPLLKRRDQQLEAFDTHSC